MTETVQIEKTARKRGAQSTQLRDILEDEIVNGRLKPGERLDEIKLALKNGDSDTLMRSAHSLKGMLSNFQAEDATETAFELEKKGKAENFDGVEAVLEKLTDQITDVDNTLRGFVDQRSD